MPESSFWLKDSQLLINGIIGMWLFVCKYNDGISDEQLYRTPAGAECPRREHGCHHAAGRDEPPTGYQRSGITWSMSHSLPIRQFHKMSVRRDSDTGRR
jgi:hypothetical protein